MDVTAKVIAPSAVDRLRSKLYTPLSFAVGLKSNRELLFAVAIGTL
jgi:hypothetical protein